MGEQPHDDAGPQAAGPPQAADPAPTAGPPGAPVSAPRTSLPSSSRMIASYLAHIEALLEGQRWQAARREASDLPQIAVALAHPQLRSSPERVRQWCQAWLLPECAAYEGLCALVPCETVPGPALRRLQLHRLAPPALPRHASAVWPDTLPAEEALAAHLSATLVGATRRWYARSACHDATVQSNLARLAVLR